jgi:hypothetical protein
VLQTTAVPPVLVFQGSQQGRCDVTGSTV